MGRKIKKKLHLPGGHPFSVDDGPTIMHGGKRIKISELVDLFNHRSRELANANQMLEAVGVVFQRIADDLTALRLDVDLEVVRGPDEIVRELDEIIESIVGKPEDEEAE